MVSFASLHAFGDAEDTLSALCTAPLADKPLSVPRRDLTWYARIVAAFAIDTDTFQINVTSDVAAMADSLRNHFAVAAGEAAPGQTFGY